MICRQTIFRSAICARRPCTRGRQRTLWRVSKRIHTHTHRQMAYCVIGRAHQTTTTPRWYGPPLHLLPRGSNRRWFAAFTIHFVRASCHEAHVMFFLWFLSISNTMVRSLIFMLAVPDTSIYKWNDELAHIYSHKRRRLAGRKDKRGWKRECARFLLLNVLSPSTATKSVLETMRTYTPFREVLAEWPAR